ncbi:4-hydroxyphenylpyruvate dioxygenase [Kitasatospora sp. RG8]|uniref:4-hydroxyphenylpyruvate dioxygenase n=1 Tax=Kitasatospora sp. RG8 TaxID=2820815 RepID=UPI001ADF0DB7|nr:4-hydroxyphenylpyruvate dioxygenase [Kitasatospora sp. RG8]MBP0452701.1 4-hydroxyphenylpyruvate dioxygenase [Kitasatospora sp. RG8]
MAVQDIAYVELYTRDKVSTVDYFESAMGFTRVADRVTPDRSSVLLRQGGVQLVVSSGRGMWRFLDEHGDGIADIALVCDDVVATRDAAVEAGAEPVRSDERWPVVSGFGEVCHTLLSPAAAAGLPAGFRWHGGPAGSGTAGGSGTAAGSGTAGAGGVVRALDHIAVCLEGGALDRYADFYRDAFGLERFSSEYVAVGGQAMDSVVVSSGSGRVVFTLVAPDPAREPGQLDAFLARNGGPGVQHLAFLVDDIVPAVRDFRERGVEFLATPGTYYEMLGDRFPEMGQEIAELREAQVLADRDEWGYLLQLFSRSPYERNTLFFELIQRRGSRGFGSSNIRALYEAVERDRLAAQ